MGYSLISSVSARSAAGNTITTGAIDTTAANLLVVHLGTYQAGPATLSDSKSNTWTALTAHDSFSLLRSIIYYCNNPTVGSGHTFTATGTASYTAICAAAFSGAISTPFDVQNGGSITGQSTVSTGSITPTQNGELIIAGLCSNNPGGLAGVSINSGFTIAESQDYTANNFSSALAYLIQGTAGAVNPAWTWTAISNNEAASIASFKASAIGLRTFGFVA
jgi:hypothetical protein